MISIRDNESSEDSYIGLNFNFCGLSFDIFSIQFNSFVKRKANSTIEQQKVMPDEKIYLLFQVTQIGLKQ